MKDYKVLVVGGNNVGKSVAFNLAMSTVGKSDYTHLIEQKVEETQQLLSTLKEESFELTNTRNLNEYKSGREKRRERRKQNRKQ
jgi:hypothetical protein